MFGSRTLLLTLVLSLVAGSAGRLDAQTPLREVIDGQVRAKWAAEKLTPAKPATDAEFLRRVTIDLVGSIPSYEETIAFLESKEPTKREKLVDRLLEDPRHAQQQADTWDMILFGRFPPGNDADKRLGFQAWLRTQFEKNVPYDELARTILKAEGLSTDGPAMYYVQYKNAPEDATESITQQFLGVQLQCARCHDHPFEEWKQLDFYGMAAFLARLEVVTLNRKGSGTESTFVIGEQEVGDIQFTGPAKDAVAGKKGEPVKPKFLHATALVEPAAKDGKPAKFSNTAPPPKPKFSRKDRLAEWIADPKNPYFTKAIVNRVWGQFMGKGISHPVDNLSPSNPPVMPELMETLAKELIVHKYDLKWLTREIVLSQAYQLSGAGDGEAMPRLYHHSRTRPLSAEELAECWRVASGWTPSGATAAKSAKSERFRPLESGYMLRFFGTPNSGAGDFQGGLQEHLYMNNGPLGSVIGGKGSLSEFVGTASKPVEDRVRRLYLQTLNRPPTAIETEKVSAYLKSGGPAADAVWALITSAEFRFNH